MSRRCVSSMMWKLKTSSYVLRIEGKQSLSSCLGALPAIDAFRLWEIPCKRSIYLNSFYLNESLLSLLLLNRLKRKAKHLNTSKFSSQLRRCAGGVDGTVHRGRALKAVGVADPSQQAVLHIAVPRPQALRTSRKEFQKLSSQDFMKFL